MISGGHGSGSNGVTAVNKTEHEISHANLDALGSNVRSHIKGVTQVILEETQESTKVYHDFMLKYVTPAGTFLFCRAAGGSSEKILQYLKTCK